MSEKIVFEGCACFRQRLVFATLSKQTVRFVKVRAGSDEPGLKEHEVSFLRLLDTITNGSKININETGTTVTFRPGTIVNGRKLRFDCGTSRGIGYFLEFLLCIAPFGKVPLHIYLSGITNDNQDPSVDIIRTVLLPVMKRFGVEDGLELKVIRRGLRPGGGGEIMFQCPVVRKLDPLRCVDVGLIKRIRGLVYTARIAPTTANRVIDKCRQVLNTFIPDVYLYTDHYTGKEAGISPGYGLSLVAETSTKALLSIELAAGQGQLPEELGETAAHLLCEEIDRGGCFDTQSQTLCFLFMTLGPEDVSKVRIGKLSPFSIQFLRDLKQFFNVTFKLKADPETTTTLTSAVGIGYTNVHKKLA
eukprot:m.48384 g.48384  ORF g.48384 m.48384 type:complete len:360 (-) comp13285_c0_seq3:72-1151(-)